MGVDRHADRALYLQLADVLREDISSGRLKPGGRLPSESELIDRHGVSRGTAREAIGTLRGEGLVVVEHGRGAFVRSIEPEPLIRRVANGESFKRARALFEEQTAEAGHAASIRMISAGSHGALPIELDERPLGGREPISEAWLGFADGRPITLTRAWCTDTEPIDGDGVEERISARMPTRDERRLLQLDDGAPLLQVVRALKSGHATLELAVGLVAAGRQSLVFEVTT